MFAVSAHHVPGEKESDRESCQRNVWNPTRLPVELEKTGLYNRLIRKADALNVAVSGAALVILSLAVLCVFFCFLCCPTLERLATRLST